MKRSWKTKESSWETRLSGDQEIVFSNTGNRQGTLPARMVGYSLCLKLAQEQEARRCSELEVESSRIGRDAGEMLGVEVGQAACRGRNGLRPLRIIKDVGRNGLRPLQIIKDVGRNGLRPLQIIKDVGRNGLCSFTKCLRVLGFTICFLNSSAAVAFSHVQSQQNYPNQMRLISSRKIVPTVSREELFRQATPEQLAAARGMEAMLWNLMIKEMRKTVPENNYIPKSHAQKVYEQMLDSEYAKVLAESAGESGSIGIAELILAQMQGKR